MELKLCRYCMEEVIKTERGIRYHRRGREGETETESGRHTDKSTDMTNTERSGETDNLNMRT